MAYEHKEGQGSLFRNDKQNDRQPDMRGTIMIQGVTYEIAAWERTSQNGRSYLSLQASLPRDREQQPARPASPSYPSYQQQPSYAPSYPSAPASAPAPAPAPTEPDPFGGMMEPMEDLPF